MSAIAQEKLDRIIQRFATVEHGLSSGTGGEAFVKLSSTTTVMHAGLSELITPLSAGFQLFPNAMLDPATPEGVVMVDSMVTG